MKKNEKKLLIFYFESTILALSEDLALGKYIRKINNFLGVVQFCPKHILILTPPKPV